MTSLVAALVALARAIPALERLILATHDQIVIARATARRDAARDEWERRVRDATGDDDAGGEDGDADGTP